LESDGEKELVVAVGDLPRPGRSVDVGQLIEMVANVVFLLNPEENDTCDDSTRISGSFLQTFVLAVKADDGHLSRVGVASNTVLRSCCVVSAPSELNLIKLELSLFAKNGSFVVSSGSRVSIFLCSKGHIFAVVLQNQSSLQLEINPLQWFDIGLLVFRVDIRRQSYGRLLCLATARVPRGPRVRTIMRFVAPIVVVRRNRSGGQTHANQPEKSFCHCHN